ncbi:MAG: cupin domain-containing protein [Thermoplasmata archaeon]
MKKYDVNDIESNGEKFQPTKLIRKEDVEVVILPFAPGQGLPMHTTPVDVFFYIIEGKITVTVGDETEEIEAGNVVLSPKGIPHTLKNEADVDGKVMVVKTPKP